MRRRRRSRYGRKTLARQSLRKRSGRRIKSYGIHRGGVRI